MWKFSKKPKKPLSQRSEAVAQSLADRIINYQLRVARYLSRKTQYWDKTSKLIALLLFCLAFGGASLWLLVRAIY